MWIRTERERPYTMVRHYVGKHAIEHFQRHAAYMAKRGWAVASAAQQHEREVVVTYHRNPLPVSGLVPTRAVALQAAADVADDSENQSPRDLEAIS